MVTTPVTRGSYVGWSHRVALVSKPGNLHTGIGRYTRMLDLSLSEIGVDVVQVMPRALPLSTGSYSFLRNRGIDVRTFLMHYPIWARYPESKVYHLTSQNLATLLLFRKPKGRVVVTVHDIIPYMVRANRQICPYRTPIHQLFDRMAMLGLKRADHLIAISRYTKQCLVEHLAIPSHKITVVYPGIDHTRFLPKTVPETIRERYRLPGGRQYLIYVGSEDPRKNLNTLIRALAKLRYELLDVELIKVGKAHSEAERCRLTELASQLGVLSAIHFLEDVPEDDLPLIYNLADLSVMPSLYEGFGFPVLEAMACGTPVICANATSLREISGNASMLFEAGPVAVENLTAAMLHLLTDLRLRDSMRANGLNHAATFEWSRTALQLVEVYGSR